MDVIQFGIDICSALEQCSKLSIIHRDIKPDNILVAPNGDYKLCDFGIARYMDQTVGSLSLKGTYTYMAPEIYHGQKYGSQADIYSLGIVLYRLMNRNRDPFINPEKQMVYYKDREEALRRRMEGEELPKPFDASEAFTEIIRKACAFAPEQRYGSAAELKRDLELFKEGDYQMTGSAMPEERVSSKRSDQGQRDAMAGRRNHRGKKVVAVVLFFFVLSGLLLYFNCSDKTTDTPSPEVAEVMEQFDDAVWISLADGDMDTFQGIWSDLLSEDEAESLYQCMQQNYYKEEADQKVVHAIEGDDETYFGEVIRYGVEDTDLDTQLIQTCIEYTLKQTNGVWNISADVVSDDINQKLVQSVDEDYKNAYVNRRNAVTFGEYLWMDETAVYNGTLDVAPVALWQNSDGSLNLKISVKNGTDETRYLTELLIHLEDSELGTVADLELGDQKTKETLVLNGEDELAISANTSRCFTVHIEAEDVLTGDETWTGISYQIKHYSE
jgi:hypothetical protein